MIERALAVAGVWLGFWSGWCFDMGSRQIGVVVVLVAYAPKGWLYFLNVFLRKSSRFSPTQATKTRLSRRLK